MSGKSGPPSQPDLERRFVLRALALLAPTLACTRAPIAPRISTPYARPRGIAQAAVEIGKLYLQRFPEHADRDVLRRALNIPDTAEPERARFARINAAIATEIENDELLDIAGWHLAPTECRLYALAALSG